MSEIKEFTQFRIKKMNIGTKTGSTYLTAAEKGCINTLGVEPEIREIIKMCEGVETVVRSQIDYLNVSIAAHFHNDIVREMNGMVNEGLAEGVYGYPQYPKNKEIFITALVVDENSNEKYIAFPNMKAVEGLTFEIDNTEDEVVALEVEIRAYNDSNSMSYYEAFADELTAEIKAKWLTEFTPDLIKKIPVA